MSTKAYIPRTVAVAIFVALNFKTADKWPDDRLNKRLSQLADNVDKDTVASIEDDAVKTQLKDVLKQISDGSTVEVEPEAAAKPKKPAADEETPAPKKKAAAAPAEEAPAPKKKAPAEEPAAKPKKADAAPKKAKEEPAKDKLGNRIGSQAANINAALSKKWTSVADVATATKLSEARVRSHFKYLEGKKLAELNDEKGARLV